MKIEGNFIYNVVVIGTGATGSQFLPFLSQLIANYKDNFIKVCDGDHFEAKNMLNQKCSEADIGQAKAEVLCARYQAVYPLLNISYVDQYIKDKEDVIKYLIGGFDQRQVLPILVGCVDNNATRKIFDEVFYDDRLPDLIYIDSGNGTADRFGQVVVGYKRGETKQVPDHNGRYDYFCTGRVAKEIVLKPVADLYPEIREVEETVDHTLSCSMASAESPQNIATNILAATTIFCIINNIIAFGEITSHVSYFNAVKPEIISREKIA